MPTARFRPLPRFGRVPHSSNISTPLLRQIRPLHSSPTSRAGYDDTIHNLDIGPQTRVIYQGFTGRVSTANAQQSLEYGTNIVGGSTPGKEGEHLGLPLYPTVRQAAEQLKPDATAVFVAAHQAAKAIEDAIDAEIPLIVAVAEFIPLHDILRISSILKTQSKSRLVGANSPGIISPLGHCRIGFQPLICHIPGHVGLISKSGTLSYETVGALTRAGIGQSLCIGMGGDMVCGTGFVDALNMFEKDPDTEAIILIGEVGGRAEQDAAAWVKAYKKRTSNPKPITGLLAGLKAPPGRIMGHAGAFTSLGDDGATVKHKAMKDAGISMVSHPTHFPKTLQGLMRDSGRDPGLLSSKGQRRGYSTLNSRSQWRARPFSQPRKPALDPPSRQIHVDGDRAKGLLKDLGIPTSPKERKELDQRFLAIGINRSNRCPYIVASPTCQPGRSYLRSKTFDYDYLAGPDEATVKAVFEHLHMDAAPPAAMATLGKILQTYTKFLREKEAYAIATHLSGTKDGNLQIERAFIGFDDSAAKSGNRHHDMFALRDESQEDPDEIEAEKDGIVYVKLKDDHSASVATLINGAGLAMNAVDALTDLGAKPTNFLDTGGKATSATIKKSFELILRDDRVKVIFVNIFGGLTLCDMIAEGIMLAFKDLRMEVPVVVRLRGTNEEKGQKMIAESGLPLHAFEDFEEAAKKCIELANKE